MIVIKSISSKELKQRKAEKQAKRIQNAREASLDNAAENARKIIDNACIDAEKIQSSRSCFRY